MQDLEARYQRASGLSDRLDYTIFYSRVRPAPLLILGWNPGGDPKDPSTVLRASDGWYENDEHEYVDSHYTIALAMRAFLVDILRLESPEPIRRLPKSNITFRRSPDAASLGMPTRQALIEARPFLREILDRVQPSVLVLEGKQTSDAFRRHYCTDEWNPGPEAPVTSPNGLHKATIFSTSRTTLAHSRQPVTTINLGHPSRYGRRADWQKVVTAARSVMDRQARIEG
jgi:hypothetical protein